MAIDRPAIYPKSSRFRWLSPTSDRCRHSVVKGLAGCHVHPHEANPPDVGGSSLAKEDHERRATAFPAMTQTCNVIRNELLPYFYQVGLKFELDPNEATWQAVGLDWLNCLDARLRTHIPGL